METFSMSPIPCIFSLGSERPLRRENSQGDYLDQINQHHISVYDPKKDAVFYQESPAFEMSGFYSDEEIDDTQILPSQSSKLSMPIAADIGVRADACLPCFPCDVKLPVKNDNPPLASLPARSTRKRSLTNMFKARPEAVTAAQKFELNLPNNAPPVKNPSSHTFSTSNESDPPNPPSIDIDEQAYYLERIVLVEPSLGDLPSSICQRLDFCPPEEEIFYENELMSGPSFSSASQALRFLHRHNEPHEASGTSTSKASYLSQARKKLKNKSINRSIVVGCQPRKKGITLQEENECFQKIWKHQQNRIEAHQRMKSQLELISEEVENLKILE
ncbi:hypothetical protein PTTG_02970 [Puccinia triticina 1-1 BBBD Race 1]|uniref:Uncharacterized protein n=1 Tax=Puccinia triticina (isolate 1-1 / race 1 (BBBD)) TaxID=630390 RepID=A0A180GNV6_PUCT1|nr:hypothetical protein PTTG_02970 [Puccinia triticina 1-1 BBBD Race 1]